MTSFVYHSPNGDRVLFASSANPDGTVDLVNEDGVLEIGGCQIKKAEGFCSPLDGGESEVIEAEIETEEIPPEGEAELTKDEIKQLLDEAGIEYDARLGIGKLKELLESIEP